MEEEEEEEELGSTSEEEEDEETHLGLVWLAKHLSAERDGNKTVRRQM